MLLFLGAALLVVAVETWTPRQRATADRDQIATACNALHAPDPATTADCTGRTVLFERMLLEACIDHHCVGRVLRHTRTWRLAPGPLEAWVRRTVPDPQLQPWAYPRGR